MVLAIGKDQTEELRERYQEFKTLFPKLKLIGREEIEVLEPNVVKDRVPEQEILALSTEEGYTIDFHKLSESFLEKSIKPDEKKIDLMLETKVKSVQKEGEFYKIHTDR
jgi:malate dehydrogenase (quinone)